MNRILLTLGLSLAHLVARGRLPVREVAVRQAGKCGAVGILAIDNPMPASNLRSTLATAAGS